MTKKYRKVEGPPVSQIFIDSISHGVGSPDLECGYCGRIHYCLNYYKNTDDGLMNFAELEKEKNPEGVVLHYDYDCVTGKKINGVMFVAECECNGLRPYEDFIWKERDTIRNFLKVRIAQEAQWIKEEIVKNKLMGIPAPESWKDFFECDTPYF